MSELEYPLKDCEDCVHIEVCKYIDTYATWKKTGCIPLDFETAQCTLYLSSAILEDLGDFYEEGALPDPPMNIANASGTASGPRMVIRGLEYDCKESFQSVIQSIVKVLQENPKETATCVLMNSDMLKLISGAFPSGADLRTISVLDKCLVIKVEESVPMGQIYIPWGDRNV